MEKKSVAVLNQELLQLRTENTALKETVTILLKEIDKIKNTQRPNLVRLELTPEQRIIETQIAYLEAVSMERALTLEETRALDLHIKNKRLLEDKSTLNADYKKVPEGLTQEDLLRIAGDVSIEETEGRSKSQTGD